MPARARSADSGDLARIAEIYNQGIAARTATFETEARTAGDIAGWLDDGELMIVAEDNTSVCAFARTSQYRPRACYAGVREFSVYVDTAHRRRGLGELVMRELIRQAPDKGIHKLVSRIFPENVGSLRLCDRLGFTRVGVYRRHGRLEGVWKDCVIVELLV